MAIPERGQEKHPQPEWPSLGEKIYSLILVLDNYGRQILKDKFVQEALQKTRGARLVVAQIDPQEAPIAHLNLVLGVGSSLSPLSFTDLRVWQKRDSSPKEQWRKARIQLGGEEPLAYPVRSRNQEASFPFDRETTKRIFEAINHSLSGFGIFLIKVQTPRGWKILYEEQLGTSLENWLAEQAKQFSPPGVE